MIQNRGFCILKVKRISPSLVKPLFLVSILFFFLSSLSHINYQKLMMTYMFATVLILILYKKKKMSACPSQFGNFAFSNRRGVLKKIFGITTFWGSRFLGGSLIVRGHSILGVQICCGPYFFMVKKMFRVKHICGSIFVGH